jgi:hypothetical protein
MRALDFRLGRADAKPRPARLDLIARLPDPDHGTFAGTSAPDRSGIAAGIGLMLVGMLLFSANEAMGKRLIATYSVGQVLLLRSAAALLVLSPMLLRRRIAWALPRQPGLHAIRITCSTLEVACFYWAVAYLPLADVMTYYLAGRSTWRRLRRSGSEKLSTAAACSPSGSASPGC